MARTPPRTATPRIPTSLAPVEGGTWVILAAGDDVAVAGIEYRLDLGPWQRYADPFVLAAGSNMRFLGAPCSLAVVPRDVVYVRARFRGSRPLPRPGGG
jgi:hypothetical protein